MTIRALFLNVGLAIAVLLFGCEREPTTAPHSSTETAAAKVDRTGLERNFSAASFYRSPDLYLSFDDPPMLEAEAVTFLEADDEVLGLVVEGEARAYDVRALSYHHVINDTIGGRPIAVTY